MKFVVRACDCGCMLIWILKVNVENNQILTVPTAVMYLLRIYCKAVERVAGLVAGNERQGAF
jgi:hypothetical protein